MTAMFCERAGLWRVQDQGGGGGTREEKNSLPPSPTPLQLPDYLHPHSHPIATHNRVSFQEGDGASPSHCVVND